MLPSTRRILVVEDDEPLRIVLRLNLQRAGFEVVAARDAEEGWKLLGEEEIHLAVVDHRLPNISGVELCRMIRATPATSNLPIIMLTAKKFELELDFLLHELRVWPVLAKPFSPARLAGVVVERLNEQPVRT